MDECQVKKCKEYAVKIFSGTTGTFEERAEGVIEAFCGALEMSDYAIVKAPKEKVSSDEMKRVYWALRDYTEKHLGDKNAAFEIHSTWNRVVERLRDLPK